MAQSSESVAICWNFENLHANLVDQAHGQCAYLASRFRPQEDVIAIATIIKFALSQVCCAALFCTCVAASDEITGAEPSRTMDSPAERRRCARLVGRRTAQL